MKNLWNKLMNMSIGKKFVIIIYSAIIFMFITLSIVLVYLSSKYLAAELLVSRLDTATQINSSISKIQKSVFNLTDYFCITPDVQNLLNGKTVIVSAQLPSTSIRLIVTHTDTNSLVFYNLKGEPINFLTTDTSTAPLNQNELGEERPFHRLISGEANYEWEFIDVGQQKYMLSEKTPKIVLWRVVKDTNTLKPIGVLAITIDSRKIISDDNNEKISQGNLFMLDSKGNEIFKKPSLHLNVAEKNSILGKALNFKGEFITTIDGSLMQVSYDRLANTDFITCIAFPYRSLNWSLQGTMIYVLFAVTLFVLLLLPLLMFISGFLTKPIKNLTHSMMKFSAGDFDSNVSLKYNDEIGTLGRVFNSMVQENKKLIEQTYILQIKEQEAELTALQAQINPHFLYNVIDTIHWSALRSG
ncbi:MAG TPA: HAMP domain-containing protein, partial [Ruminiclostridium sp.]